MTPEQVSNRPAAVGPSDCSPIPAAAEPAESALGDIPERRRAEENLGTSEALHRTLFEESIAAIYLTDSQGRFLEANPAGCALVGYTADELRGLSFTDLVDPTDFDTRPLQFDRLRTEGRLVAQRRLRHKDGRILEVEIRSALLPDGRITGLARDITEASRTERLLRESEERFLSMAEASPLGLHAYQLDAADRLILTGANPAADSILGLRHSALLGLGIEEAFPGLAATGIPATYRRVCRDGKPWRSEHVDYFDGRIRGAYEVIAFRTGPRTMAVLFEDIRERLSAQAALRLQSAALESAANGILITDCTGLIVWCNEAFCQMTGYRPDELVGRNPRLLRSDRNPAGFYEELWATIRAGKVWRGELVNRRKDGSHYTQEQTITPVRAADGQISHFVAIQQDTTERHRMEIELRQSRDRFQTVFQASPLSIAISRVSDGRLLDVNPSFVRTCEMSREEMIGRTTVELGLWDDPIERQRMVALIQGQGAIHNFEMRISLHSGRQVDALLSIVTILYGGEECLLTIATDITERKRMEEKLRQAAKMESLGTLAGGVAHDFNNLLTVIQGHTSLALSSDLCDLNDLRDNLRQVATAAERAANLTRQLLAFSRQESMKPRLVDLNEIIGRQTRMLRRIIGEDIVMQIHSPTALPSILADPTMMEQVLLNLAANSRDAMPQGGTLTISTDSILLDAARAVRNPAARQGEFVRLTVADTGMGIPVEVLPRIYEPFFTTKQVGKGTGLGLATVHGIVQRHQGWIDVETAEHRGTTFRIHLPAAGTEPEAGATSPPQASLPTGRGTILVAEDECTVRALSKRVLESCGYRILEVESGVDALALMADESVSIDLLLTDLVMPGGINGRDLVERLRIRHPELKVVFMSGYTPGVLDAPLRTGESLYFLQKPFTPFELAQTVRACLESK